MPISVALIEKGGSGRKFWRLEVGNESLILVRYSEERPENRYYVAIAQFLANVGVRVPTVHFHDEREGIILMEDAGQEDLRSHSADPWLQRRALYERTLDQALILHTRAHLAPDRPGLQQEFNAPLYRWEQDYFIEHCLKRHFGLAEEIIRQKVPREKLAAIAEQLAAEPRCLVHRDFQSQNVIVRGGEVCLIDFQGLRPGLAQYDLASLLLDPYVNLSPAEREELLDHYLSGLHGAGYHEAADFKATYDLCAMQRLMQALGAYGKLGYLDGKYEFLEHIAVAMPRLIEVLRRISGLEDLATFLATLPLNNLHPQAQI
jgi:aminoglycoside/choline kinase family phosphotransferase